MDWSGASSGVPSTLVQLSFEATGLRNRDVMGTSDPMLVAFGINQGGQEEELGRSETIPNTLNPKWVYHLTIPYRFEEIQHLRFVVYDVDSNYREKTSDKFKLEKQDYLGEVKTTLAEILASPPHVLTRQLQRGPRNTDLMRPSGTLIIRAEEVAAEFGRPEEVELALRCANLENMETFSKSDPFVRISKSAAEGAWTPVYQTEHIQNNLNPKWGSFVRTLQQLCNGNKNRTLLVECYDYESNGKHKLIGGVKTTINQLQELCLARTPLILTRQSKISKNVNKSRGNLFVDTCKITPVISFLNYVFGGCEISFFVAIDFTASNGDPRSPTSLHFIDPTGRPNAYQTAIQAVGGVLQYYDSDKRFPCWGFGARIDGSVSHCFPLNNNVSTPEVEGIEGIQAAYFQAVYSVELYGPTWFAPVIRQAASIAAQYQRQHKYFVLLIITDGAILDMQDTIAAIVEASYLPLSLLIVGVGNADFSAMDFLDSDDKKLTSQTGRVAARDIVQFVPIRGGSLESAATKLLKELPDQLLSYMKTNGVLPSRPT
ncbi:hypothetical protein KC19_5G094200 [Ceratodon purpureus]|uniref:C2 domain-containing protein n=1 Tax=Ceratodon purpureus TaxID=3225 RepID=A0A8T0I134_CERPU|nr:hypothetical protein KC19_5G094200 [Ceratodon purpureus]